MGKKQTEKSPYESRFGGGFISAAQYLAENMCSRKARSTGEDLPQKFWNDKFWAKELKLQLKHANDLLKDYTVESIVAALKHPNAKKVYSLGLKSVLLPLIEKEMAKKKLETKINEENRVIVAVDTYQQPRKPFGGSKKNLRNLLREAENG